MARMSMNLDDVLEDSPQTRCILNIFESDVCKVQEYMRNMQSVLERLVTAQTEMTSAVGELSSLLGNYKLQNFPLENNESVFPVVVEKFHSTVSELSSWMEIVSQQLNNCSLYPVAKFVREINDLLARKEIYHSLASELDSSISRHAKLSKKEAGSKKFEEVLDELSLNRRRFHLAGLHYFENLNKLQFSRRVALLEPILSVIYAFRSFCHVGHQALTQEKESFDFFTRTQEQLQSLHNEQESEWKNYQQLLKTVGEIERLNPTVYNVESLNSENNIKSDTDTANKESKEDSYNEKRGYLFLKSKSGLMHKWDRLYFFLQSGNLMAQAKDEIAGKSLMELIPCVKASCADQTEDRRNVFYIFCYKTKRQIALQANSSTERQQWIEAINGTASQLSTYQQPVPTAELEKGVAVANALEGADKISPTNANSNVLDSVDEPIQFDLLTPSVDLVEREDSQSAPTEELAYSLEDVTNSAYCTPIKFLGSLDISDDRDTRLVLKATRKILETRTKFNITKYVDAIMVVEKRSIADDKSPESTPRKQKIGRLLLLDKATNEIKAAFRLDDLASWRQDFGLDNNNHIVALVVRTRLDRSDGGHRFTCYLLQTDNDSKAKEICHNLTESSRSIFESLAHCQLKDQGAKSECYVESIKSDQPDPVDEDTTAIEENIFDGVKQKSSTNSTPVEPTVTTIPSETVLTP